MRATRRARLRPLPEISVPLTPTLVEAFATVVVAPDDWPRLDALHDDPTLDWTGFLQDVVRIADDEAALDRHDWDSDWLLTLVAIGLGVLRGEDRCGGLDLYHAKLVDIARRMGLADPFEIARNSVRLLFAGSEALREINVRIAHHVGARLFLSRYHVEHALTARRIVLSKLSRDFKDALGHREATGASRPYRIVDQAVDAQINLTTAASLRGLTPRAAFVRALDGKWNHLPGAVVNDLLDIARHEQVVERRHVLTADDDDTIPILETSDHDEIDAKTHFLLDRLRQAESPKLRALADVLSGDDPPLTLGEAAQRLAVSDRHLRRLVRELTRGARRRRRTA
jgi:AraC-like DNA-binding protein